MPVKGLWMDALLQPSTALKWLKLGVVNTINLCMVVEIHYCCSLEGDSPHVLQFCLVIISHLDPTSPIQKQTKPSKVLGSSTNKDVIRM